MAPASHGLLGRIQRANDDASHRFGPNTAEVEAFINAAAALVIAGSASRMETGIRLANEILDSGQALEKLREFQRFFSS